MDQLFRGSLKQSQALWAHKLWKMFCAEFRHFAGSHARVVLDGAACRPGVLGVDRVVPVVVRVLVSW